MSGLRLTARGERLTGAGFAVLVLAVLSLAAHLTGGPA